ncbi:hypothetical protein [Desulfurobacterium atlanticum]|uniref:Uncharacterized protein n=1 Tax=Desulfurobacterium atlanticum TaxID=240169 RepID=A0A238YR56_9BACT|nr:hypothetical protein [Desulfurobacterium atlanticum]SNR73462.1 hypothetical protein SAMN06265340_104117 [Desulfurobacterium atlanticum]
MRNGKCSCRKGKTLSAITCRELEELFSFLDSRPELKSYVFELINLFRPTDPQRVIAERIFHTVRECYDIGVISFSEAEELLQILKKFFLRSTDTRRGDFLEILLSKRGPLKIKGRYRRINQCRLYKGRKEISPKEIDVAFSGPDGLELHECKANMVRQWRDPLYKRTKKGRKLIFLNSITEVCGSGKVFVFCTGLDGRFATMYVKKLFKRYGYKNIDVAGREELL